jgi:hydrogenase expression/formation protein HypE
MVDREHIQLAHGGGGELTAELVEGVILPALGGPQRPGRLADAAIVPAGGIKFAFTTDSYVVQPLEFPGGDIGKLSVVGTVNDLSVVGAKPLAISLALVVREGLEIVLLRRLLESAGRAAREAGVSIVTGDTKVVERGASDGLVINTAGIGLIGERAALGFERVRTGDRIILSGPLGEHGLAVMSRRRGLSFSAELVSDCASLAPLTAALLDSLGENVHFMRDPTRGGLAAVLADLAEGTGRNVEIEEASIPVNRTARAAAEMLGLDLLAAANEGKLVAVVAASAAEEAVEVLMRHAIAAQAAIVGTVGRPSGSPLVEMTTSIGGRRILRRPYGEELPRIC